MLGTNKMDRANGTEEPKPGTGKNVDPKAGKTELVEDPPSQTSTPPGSTSKAGRKLH